MSADRAALFAGRTGERKDGSAARLALPSGAARAKPGSTRTSGSTSFASRGGGSTAGAASAARREAQLKEAEVQRKAANKYMLKTLTRWTPDYFSAAPLFEKAASCFRAAGEDSLSVSMFVTAAECHAAHTVSAYPAAAKNFKEAAVVEHRAGREREAAELYARCADAWIESCEGGRAVEYLGLAARYLEALDPEAATDLYVKAAMVMVPDGSDRTTDFIKVVGGTNVLSQGIDYLASTNRLDKCLEVVNRYSVLADAEGMQHTLVQLFLTSCVLTLSMGDYVKADKDYANVHLQSNIYLYSPECKVEEDMLTAFKNSDATALHQAQNDRVLLHLSTPIVRLAKSLAIPGEEEEIIPPAWPMGRGTATGGVNDRLSNIREKYESHPPQPPLHEPSLRSPAEPTPPSELAPNVSQGRPTMGSAPGEGLTEVRCQQGGNEKGTTVDSSLGRATTADFTGDNSGDVGEVDWRMDDLIEGVKQSSIGDKGAEASEDDLEAAIEAARQEAQALDRSGSVQDQGWPQEPQGMQRADLGNVDDSEEDDEIDLT